jgi:hypothetical protein
MLWCRGGARGVARRRLRLALNDGVLHLAVFDGMGHGLAAAGVTAFALSAYRRSTVRGVPCDTHARFSLTR